MHKLGELGQDFAVGVGSGLDFFCARDVIIAVDRVENIARQVARCTGFGALSSLLTILNVCTKTTRAISVEHFEHRPDSRFGRGHHLCHVARRRVGLGRHACKHSRDSFHHCADLLQRCLAVLVLVEKIMKQLVERLRWSCAAHARRYAHTTLRAADRDAGGAATTRRPR